VLAGLILPTVLFDDPDLLCMVLFQVSNESGRVALTRLYLVKASTCDSTKLQSCTLYTVMSIFSKVMNVYLLTPYVQYIVQFSKKRGRL
jgi:hypothetical protein